MMAVRTIATFRLSRPGPAPSSLCCKGGTPPERSVMIAASLRIRQMPLFRHNASYVCPCAEFQFERTPKLFEQSAELLCPPELDDVARTSERYFLRQPDAAGPRRHDDDSVGEPDRLLEIMRD